MYSLGKKLDSKHIELFGKKNHNVSNVMGKKLHSKKAISKEYFKEDEIKKSDLEKM
jgi:hypothetical protein